MELRSAEELMDLLHAFRGVAVAPERGGAPVDLHDHALRTAALLRRGRPADKELQLAGLVHGIGRLPCPDGAPDPGPADRAARAVRPLLGPRVALLVRLHTDSRENGPAVNGPLMGGPLMEDALTLRQAHEAGRTPGLDAGVLEDWRTVLELVAARHAPPVAAD